MANAENDQPEKGLNNKHTPKEVLLKRRRGGNEEADKAGNVEPDPDSVESKRPKRTVQQEIALDELSNCDAILKSESTNLNTKMATLTTFFDSLVNHNINIYFLKENFNEWVKSATLTILQEVRFTSVNLFTYLRSALQTSPTIFESICDKVLPVVMFYPKGDDVLDSYNDFMKLLVQTFEKLRRFPKLVAKVLCCVRDNENVQTPRTRSSAKLELEALNSSSSLSLPPGFINSIGPIISLLPSGQIIDLWKTLHHNFTEECLKKIDFTKPDKCASAFLPIVTQIFIEFFKNIKLADAGVAETTLERASELMLKFQNECLKPLSNLALHKHGLEFSKPFLQNAYTWAELNGLLIHYNMKYRKITPAPQIEPNTNSTNLTYLHPYLDCDQWSKLAQKLQNTPFFVYLIKLVAQKLKYMVLLERLSDPCLPKINQETNNQLVRKHVKSAANFLWIEQTKLLEPTLETMEMCSLVAEFIKPEETIELCNGFIKKVANRQEDINGTYYGLINSSCNQQFQCGLLLESLAEVLKRLGKMKILQNEIKMLLTDVLSAKNRAVILQIAICNTKDNVEDNQKDMTTSLLSIVNEIIESAVQKLKFTGKKSDSLSCQEEFSMDLVCDILKYLSELPMEDYPLHLKTIVLLCSLIILTGITKSASQNLVDEVGHTFIKSGSSLHGNAALFALKWTNIFKWFCGHCEFFSESVQKEMISVILRNIYISSKSVAEFEEEFNIMCESKMTPSNELISLLLLEFLTAELHQGAKTKLTHQLQTHTRKLTHFVVKSLDDIGNYGQINAYSVEASCYRSCWLVQMSLKALSTCEIENATKEDMSQFKLLLSRKILEALSRLSNDSNLQADLHADVCKANMYAFKFLHCICKAKEEFKGSIPNDFVLQLWNAVIKHELCETIGRGSCEKGTILTPKHLLKDIYEAASVEEFKEISSLIIEMVNRFSIQNISDAKVEVLIKVLDELIEAELISEKKQARWQTLEECLHAFLVLSLKWEAKEHCLSSIVLPFLRFQGKLLRRRRPMGNLTSLATCLASITAVPIKEIKDIELYSKVFSCVADLLNAFALHRLDVVSFRTHIFLQCFQFLVECLFMKADQKNNLSDVEIFHIRHCAHSIERICQSMKLGQKEFSRVSPYFVAVLIRQLEQVTVYPVVKNPLLSGCYKLLDLCDEHGVAQLNSMLSAASREVFKPVYEMYKKFYRYKGRV